LLKEGFAGRASRISFLSHSSKDKPSATKFALDLNFCAVDVWLDDWKLQIGQSLSDGIAKAMDDARYIAILITGNYNLTVWTKTEYKKALSREQTEGRVVYRKQLDLETLVATREPNFRLGRLESRLMLSSLWQSEDDGGL
jgi:hypothetical protein